MSWISEIYAENEWVGSAYRFATAQEALSSGSELMSRWYKVEGFRAVSSEDPVNYKFENGRNLPVPVEEETHQCIYCGDKHYEEFRKCPSCGWSREFDI